MNESPQSYVLTIGSPGLLILHANSRTGSGPAYPHYWHDMIIEAAVLARPEHSVAWDHGQGTLNGPGRPRFVYSGNDPSKVAPPGLCAQRFARWRNRLVSSPDMERFRRRMQVHRRSRR
jgi:hypothetical protein